MNAVSEGISSFDFDKILILPIEHSESIILCLPVLLTFEILIGIPPLLNLINSGLIPTSVFE